MSRRVLALILALSMAFGILGANVYATDGSESFAPDVSVADTSEAEPESEVSEAEESVPEKETEDEAGESAPEEEDSSAQEENVASEPEETLAVQAVDSGTCGENLTWTLDDSGTLIISGTGKMNDYDYYSYYGTEPPWRNNNSIKTVVIKNGVTSIGNDAFYRCYLTSISIPNSVTSIGDAAFSGSTLKSITIPNSVTSIGNSVFYCCKNLTSITIPNSVTSISNRAFDWCSNLTSITIPNSVTSIGEDAFRACENLTSITIPNSVTSIGDGAFSGSGLTSIAIPNSVTNIGEVAFADCSNLSDIQVDSRNQNYSSVGGVLFDKAKTELICCPGGKSGHYTVPNSVMNIGYGAFGGCRILTSITIPNSVTSIGDAAFIVSALKSITIPNSVTSIGISAFSYCDSLTSIKIPNSVTTIGGLAFEGCKLLTSVKIPDSVTSIGYAVFRSCVNLKSVSIPNSVKNIEERAFYGCEGLTSIKIPKSIKSIGKHAFGYYYESGEDKPLSNFTISGYLGTAAETYADENGFKLKIQDKATLSSVKWDKGKKQVTVTWKKNVKGKGYQIQFSKKKNFSKVDRKVEVKKNKKTSVTISGIRKGTYYVRIRIVKGKNTSKWSAVKKVKVS